MVLVLKMAESSTISIASPTFGFIIWERKTHHFYFGWATPFPVSSQQSCCFLTTPSIKSLYHNPRPFSAVGNNCFCSPITVSVGILVILVLGVGEYIWLGRYPHISRGPSQSLSSTGGKWTILDMERECSHKKTLLSVLRPSPGGKESSLPIMLLFPTFKSTCFEEQTAGL